MWRYIILRFFGEEFFEGEVDRRCALKIFVK